MYLGSWKINDWLTFPVNTHNPTTGAAADATAVPAYRIYEDETGTPIVTGNTAKLDDANTLGFYSERVQLTAASGFEAGKSYTIYVSATVATILGTMSHSFQMQAEHALHADWQNGGRLDLLLDAVKERTDNLPDDPADQSLVIAATNALLAELNDMAGTGFVSATDSLEAIRDRGDAAWITANLQGGGAIAFTYTLTNEVGGAPIEGAEVWATTDIAGANTIARGFTDNFGQVTFALDAGTYYFWRKKSGWSFDNPDTEIVS